MLQVLVAPRASGARAARATRRPIYTYGYSKQPQLSRARQGWPETRAVVGRQLALESVLAGEKAEQVGDLLRHGAGAAHADAKIRLVELAVARALDAPEDALDALGKHTRQPLAKDRGD